MVQDLSNSDAIKVVENVNDSMQNHSEDETEKLVDVIVQDVDSDIGIEEEVATSENVSDDDEIIFKNRSPTKNLRLRMPMPIKEPTKKKSKKSAKNTAKEANLCDIELGYAFVASREPKTLHEALQSDDSDNWKDAMDSEIQSLEKNQTWQLVKLPQNRKVIDNKWVYKIKERPNGQIDRDKARLVVRGFTQEYGIDYGNIQSGCKIYLATNDHCYGCCRRYVHETI